MFNSKDNSNNKPAPGAGSGSLNMIGAGTVIHGEIVSDGDIRIEGQVKGTVTSKAKVALGATGQIDGDLFCENADISGKIFGQVKCGEMLFLKESGYIEGDIATAKMVVEAGAKFNGNCSMGVKEMKQNNEKYAATQATQLQKEAV